MDTLSPETVKVVGIGQACMDYLGHIPYFPHEDDKIELLDIESQCGGPASTALVVLSRLGVKTSFIGSISNDPFGDEIKKGLDIEGVDHRFLKITPGYTSQIAFIPISKEHGKRTIFWHRGTVPHLKPEDIDLSPFCNAEILHIDGLMMEASKEAVSQAKKMGIKVVMDAGTLREGSLELASKMDFLITSQKFVQPLMKESGNLEYILRMLHESGPDIVVITLGPKGSIGFDGEIVHSQDAFKVDAIDTTGAGDVFHGAYIYCILNGKGMRESMIFASAVAAMKCRYTGARAGIPSIAEIKSYLKPFYDLNMFDY